MSAWTDPRRYARRRKMQRQGTGTVRARTAPYTADHVLWHAPRDSYEKQVTLYLEEMRAEYAKAFSRIDIFSKVEGNLNTPEDPESRNTRMREMKAEILELKQSKAEDGLIGRRHKNSMNEMYKEIKRLSHLLDSLPEDVKERMADNLKDSDSVD